MIIDELAGVVEERKRLAANTLHQVMCPTRISRTLPDTRRRQETELKAYLNRRVSFFLTVK